MENNIDFSNWYKKSYKRLFHIAYRITRDAPLAEDVVQETFIKAMNKAGTIIDESKMGAWLSVITTRTAIDIVRRERKKTAIPLEQLNLEILGKNVVQNLEEEIETSFLKEQINDAIMCLASKYQDVMLLKFMHDLQEEEIAKVLALNPFTVKTRIHRARKQLKLLCLEQVSA